MTLIQGPQLLQHELLSINKCRKLLKAYFISDITEGFGTHLSSDAWTGKCSAPESKQLSWPFQGPPMQSDWNIWRNALRTYILGWGLRLKQPLGDWMR
jgi:hypothetical protein